MGKRVNLTKVYLIEAYGVFGQECGSDEGVINGGCWGKEGGSDMGCTQ